MEQSPGASKDGTKNCSILKLFRKYCLETFPVAQKKFLEFSKGATQKCLVHKAEEIIYRLAILSWEVKTELTDRLWKALPQFISLEKLFSSN